MVNKRGMMLTRSRSTPADLKSARRPKRNVSPKNLHDDTSGLSWREERELKKALYASLQEARRQSREEQTDDSADASRCSAPDLSDCHGNKSSQSRLSDFSSTDTMDSRKGLGFSTTDIKKKKIHAQRKFAQGSLPSTPQETPSKPKFKVSPVKLFPQRPKTEDFLTYLCFRGTSILPPHLDLMNIQREEAGEASHPGTPSANGRAGFTRDSSPASSSTSHSHNNDDSMDSSVLTSRSQTPNRKAARASASTPETARGFAGLRASLMRNKSSRTCSPLSKQNYQASMSQVRKTRYSDNLLHAKLMKIKKSKQGKVPEKRTVSDRMSLKRKAMATLAAAKMSTKKKEVSQKPCLRHSASDSVLVTKRSETRQTAMLKAKDEGCKKREKSSQGQSGLRSNTESSRKRKSSGMIPEKHDAHSEPKKGKVVRTSQRVKYLLRVKSKTSSSGKVKRHFPETETHPNKRLSTAAPKVSVNKRPVTRASSHLKAALTAAKRLASQRLKEVRKISKPRREVSQEKETRSSADSKRSSSAKELSKGDNHHNKRREEEVENKVCLDAASDKMLKDQVANKSTIPDPGDPAAVLTCPTYFPTDEQFRDPISYIETIKAEAEPFGMCRIVPPTSWKMESRMIEDMRFTSELQHIHKLYNRSGPCAHRMECIKRHFESTGSDKFQHPQIGGVELDLVKLYDIVCKYGGMQRIVDKKKWMKVADAMKISKQSQDRVKKLYSAYCKYLLSYETLAEEEREKIEQAVIHDRQKREKSKSASPDKCGYRGRSQPLCAYSRAARNIQMMYGQEGEVTPEQVEADYWKVIDEGTSHVAVQGASLDTSIYGSMFPVKRDNPYSRHPWNLHNFIQSKGSVLNHLGLIANVTVPTLHVRMLYSTSCLSANIHNLAQVHYHHQGDPVIWYAVPKNQNGNLKNALHDLIPGQMRDKSRLLIHDSVMVPPEDLIEKGISISRCVQSIRQFVVIFPSVHHASISTGYSLAESVHYATENWIPDGCRAAQDLSDNQEGEQFSMDAMLVFLAQDLSTPESTLALVLPNLEKVVDREIEERRKLQEAGLKLGERLPNKVCKTPHRASDVIEEINICDVSKKICYLSMVLNEAENCAFSLRQGFLHISKKKNLKSCKLMYRYTQEELTTLVREVKARLHGHQNGSVSSPKKKSTRKGDGKVSPQTSK